MEQVVADKIYRPIKVLLTLCLDAKKHPELLSHIKVDLNATKGRRNDVSDLNILDLVVQYQFRRLVPLFLSMNVSAHNALRIAVGNGDDNIVKILLDNGVSVGLEEAEIAANSLGYRRIAARLRQSVNRDSHKIAVADWDEAINEFAPSFECKGKISEGEDKIILMPDGGYSTRSEGYNFILEKCLVCYHKCLNLLPYFLLFMTNLSSCIISYLCSSFEILRPGQSRCLIDHLAAEDLGPENFASYLRTNKPLLVSFNGGIKFLALLRDLFSISNLLQTRGHIELSISGDY